MLGVDDDLILLEYDPGDEAPESEREHCPGPMVPCDQTLYCQGCGLAWWSDENDLFEAVHGASKTWTVIDPPRATP